MTIGTFNREMVQDLGNVLFARVALGSVFQFLKARFKVVLMFARRPEDFDRHIPRKTAKFVSQPILILMVQNWHEVLSCICWDLRPVSSPPDGGIVAPAKLIHDLVSPILRLVTGVYWMISTVSILDQRLPIFIATEIIAVQFWLP